MVGEGGEPIVGAEPGPLSVQCCQVVGAQGAGAPSDAWMAAETRSQTDRAVAAAMHQPLGGHLVFHTEGPLPPAASDQRDDVRRKASS